LTVIARQLRLRFDQSIESSGITRAKWTLIAVVARNPGSTQRTIAAALEVTEVTAGRLIDRLCADGYLERRENPQDRRGYSVHLTSAAQPMLDKLGKIAKVHEDEVFAGLNDDDLIKLNGLLDKVARNIANPSSPGRHENKK
jgi:MarR family transcriptional regulator for hemolysin